MGFSVGGHLALSTLIFHSQDFATAPSIDPRHTPAQVLILCYPVIIPANLLIGDPLNIF
jgi:hypothetical protein